MKAHSIWRQTLRGLVATGLVASLASTAPAIGLSAVAAAQQTAPPSLAELARKEAERRKTTKEAKKVITTKDLPESARKGASSSSPAPAGSHGEAAPAAAGTPGAEQKPAAAGDDKGEAAWKDRITQAREVLRRNEAFLEALQTRINSLTNDSQSKDDPIQRAKLRDDRLKALDEMERLKADIQLSRKRIEDIEEEARKAGVPPGWLR